MSISQAQTPFSGWSRPRKAEPKYNLIVRFTCMC